MKKFKYNVSICAEGNTFGTIVLTEEEAQLINRVTCPHNWDNLVFESYCGTFNIDLDSTEEMEES